MVKHLLLFLLVFGVGVLGKTNSCTKYHNFVSNNDKSLSIDVYYDVEPETYKIDLKIIVILFSLTDEKLTFKHLMSQDEIFKVMNEGGKLKLRINTPQFETRAKIEEMYLNKRLVCKQYVGDVSKVGITRAQLNVNLKYELPTTTTIKSKYRRPLLPRNVICGMEKPIISLIVGGIGTTIGNWPWSAALIDNKIAGTLEFYCGGAIISEKLIVSAAHCVKKYQANDVLIRIGADDPVLPIENDDEILLSVKNIFIHPEFDETKLRNDIALLESETITFSNDVRPVCLWYGNSDQSNLYGKSGEVVGWGINDDDEIASELSQLTVPIVTDYTCRSKNNKFIPYLWGNNFCAGGLPGKGPCNGDSGSGLYIKQNNLWHMRGIVSFVLDQNCHKTDFSIYTDVAKYTDWILRINESL